jgi:hypothetical protein
MDGTLYLQTNNLQTQFENGHIYEKMRSSAAILLHMKPVLRQSMTWSLDYRESLDQNISLRHYATNLFV